MFILVVCHCGVQYSEKIKNKHAGYKNDKIKILDSILLDLFLTIVSAKKI